MIYVADVFTAFNSHHCFCTKTGPNSKFPTNVWWGWRHLEMIPNCCIQETAWQSGRLMLHFQIKMCFSCLRLARRDPFFLPVDFPWHPSSRRKDWNCNSLGRHSMSITEAFFGKVWELAHWWYSRALNMLLTCINRRGRRFGGCVFPTKCGEILRPRMPKILVTPRRPNFENWGAVPSNTTERQRKRTSCVQ